MKMERSFTASCSFDQASDALGQEDTLLSLFPGKTEVVDRSGDRITTRTHYTALGRQGTATFHIDYLMDGGIRFEKVCDGNVWKSLAGRVELEDRHDRVVYAEAIGHYLAPRRSGRRCAP